MRRATTAVIDFYWGSGIADDVPALTYYLLLSLAPFALGLAVIGATAFGGDLTSAEVAAEVGRYVPAEIRDDVSELVLATRQDSPRLVCFALLAMLWTSSGAIGVIERCLLRLLDRKPRHLILGRVRNIGLGAALALVISASIAGASLVGGLAGQFDLHSGLVSRLVTVGHLIGTLLLVAAIYRAVAQQLSWRSALIGAIPAAMIFQVAPLLVGSYFRAVARFAPGSLFLSVAVIAAACFLLAIGLLVGAGLAARDQKGRITQTRAVSV